MNKELQFLLKEVVCAKIARTTCYSAIFDKTLKPTSDFDREVQKMLQKGGGDDE